MSDGDAAAVEVAPAAPVVEEVSSMSVEDALKDVLKIALHHDGLARGLREAVKTLDRRQAHLCILAEDCSEPAYTKLVEALCTQHNINLLKVPEQKKLGEMVGLCKIDREGNARKVVRCSCVVVKDYGVESRLSLNSSPFAMHTRHLKCIPSLHHLQISSSSTNAASQTPETLFALSWHLASRQIQN